MQKYNRLKMTITLKKVSIHMDEEHNELFNKYLESKMEPILKYFWDKILSFFSPMKDYWSTLTFRQSADERQARF